MRPAAAAVLWGVLLCTGCASPQVVYPGTNAFARRVETFALSPDEAHRLVFQSTGSPSRLGAAIDRWYLFNQPQKAWLDLGGYYVSGDTGAVEYRTSGARLVPDLLGNRPARLPRDPYKTVRPIRPSDPPTP